MSTKISIKEIVPSPFQKRKDFTEEDIQDLADDIGKVGLLNAITVRKVGKKYELIAGERRWRAVQILSWPTVDADIREASDEMAYAMHTSENLKRKNLTPFEEADTISGLIEIATLDEAAKLLGRSVSWVARRASLLNLSAKWKKSIEKTEHIKRWPVECLEIISRMPISVQDEMLIDWERNSHRSATVKDLNTYIKEKMMRLASAPWTLSEGSKPCTKCEKRSGAAPNLFSDGNIGKNDQCLDIACWKAKMHMFLEITAQQLREKNKDSAVVFSDYDDSLPECSLRDAALSHYSYTKVKEGTKGAIPALVIGGPGVGKVIYIKKPTVTQSSAKASGPKTMEEKQASLAKRRTILFMQLCIKEIESLIEQKHAPSICSLINLVSLFGAKPDKSGCEYEYEYTPWLDFKESIEADPVVLFERVAPCIIDAIQLESKSSNPDKKKVDKLEFYLGISVGAIWRDAVDQIPEPKSWAIERAQAAVEKPAIVTDKKKKSSKK